MPDPLYILTDATGYTTCCRAGHSALMVELSRQGRAGPLRAPITVDHWSWGGAINGGALWSHTFPKHMERFTWPV